MTPSLTLPRSAILAALLAGLAALVLAPRAEAGPLVAAAEGCGSETLERPFLPWLDPAQYVLAPDGTFTRGATGWTRAGAAVVADNEPWFVHGAERAAALELREGSSATSPAMCVGIEHPTLRFFARNIGSTLGTLGVEVLFEDATGAVRSLPLDAVSVGSRWAPTLPLPIVANLLPLLPGERTAVAFRFTPQGADSAWRIDGVYVDPWGKG